MIYAGEKEFQICKKKLVGAQTADLLYNLDWKPPQEPLVVVGPTFYRIPFDAKENFVRTINCFLTAGKQDATVVNFDILDYRTNKKVARFSYGELEIK